MSITIKTRTILALATIISYVTQNNVIQVGCSSAMKRLYEDLFTDYNRLILPVANNKTKVTVNLGLKLGQILDLNLKQQILSTNVWVEQTWHDYKLQWNPNDYEGIDMIHVPAENIWIPDIVLFNNADGNYELTLVAKARLYSNGTVVWKPPTMFRSTCEIDVEYFPFDIQTCYLRFGSWTYAGDEVELKHVGPKRGNKIEIGIDLSQFYKNVEWDIIDVPAYFNEVYYECCEEPFPDITFAIVIKRKMLFYLVNLILPVALMTFMTVSVFYLPSDSNEKVTLSISILTSLIVFILLMLEIIPASSLAVPLFGKYLVFALVLVSLSACVSVCVLNLHHRSPSLHEMSPRMRRIFLKVLPRILRLNRPDPRERSSLNRFRKKKIAQQLLKASSANKVYDLAQPLATSLNLIETLHQSYDPKDDGLLTEDDEGRYFRRYVDKYIERMQQIKAEEGDGRRLEGFHGEASTGTNNCACSQRSKTKTCCPHNKCCSQANQPHMRPHMHKFGAPVANCCVNSMNWTESGSGDVVGNRQSNKLASLDDSSAYNNCHIMSAKNNQHIPHDLSQNSHHHHLHHQHQHQHHLNRMTSTSCGCTAHQSAGQMGMLNDDTLDMTFDYDEQDNINVNVNVNNKFDNSHNNVGLSSSRCSANINSSLKQSSSNAGLGHELDDLPSPPPPPRQLTQLSDSLQHSKISGRSNLQNESSVEESSSDVGLIGDIGLGNGESALRNQSHLVDKLINSINMINNGSDEIETTPTTTATTSSNGNDNNDAQQDNRSDVCLQTGSKQRNNYLIHQQQCTQSISPISLANNKQQGTNNTSGDNNHLSHNDLPAFAQFQQQQQKLRQKQLQDSLRQQVAANKGLSRCICNETTTHDCNHLPQIGLLDAATQFNGNKKQASKTLQHSSSNSSTQPMINNPLLSQHDSLLATGKFQQQQQQYINRDFLTNATLQSGESIKQPSDLLMSLRLSYDQMPAHVRAAIRSILFIADTIKNEDDENSAIEDWESVSMVVDRLFLWIFFLLCTFGSLILLALAPSLYDTRASIDDKLRIDIPPSNCSASLYGH